MLKSKKARSAYWDNLKGILILLVVGGHLCERYIDDSSLLVHIWILVYSFHMPLFIFVNGYFAQKSSSPAEYKSLKMLKYYILMQFLFVMGDYLIRDQEFKFSILADPAYCCWYLIFLVYAYLFVKILPKENHRKVKWLLGSVLASLAIGFDVSVGHAYGVGRTFYFLPYFFLGALWADTGKELKSSRAKKGICILAAIVIFAVLWRLGSVEWFNRSVFAGHKSYEALYPGHPVFALFNKAAAYVTAILLGGIVLNLIPRRKTFFCFLGQHTLLIYLVHIFVFPMEFHLIRNLQFTGIKELNSAIILLILLVSAAGICYILFMAYQMILRDIIDKIKKRDFLKGEKLR